MTTEETLRIRGYLTAQGAKLSPDQIIGKVEEAMARLREAATAVPAARFTDPPAPGEWSANEVMVHVVEADRRSGGAVAFGDDVERLVAARKPGLAFTLGAMGSRQHNFYNDAFKRAGYADTATEVQRLWLDGKRDEATARVPDEMALKANLLGTEAMVRERLRVYSASGLTTLRVDPAGATARRAARHARPADGARQDLVAGKYSRNDSADERRVRSEALSAG